MKFITTLHKICTASLLLAPLLLIVLLPGFSCKKPKEICCHSILPIRPAVLGFVGYDSTELNDMTIRTYQANTAFQMPVDTFYLRDYPFSYRHDTAIILPDTLKIYVSPGVDYLISSGDSSDIHTITGQRNGATERYCFESEHCSPGSHQPVINVIENIHVDSVLTMPDFSISYSSPMVYLKK